MATFEVMKKSLETLEKNVKVSKKLLEERVNSLDEMKRNRQEAATEEDRRELKIAIESLENIIDKDRVAVADLEASYKDLKEEVDKAEDVKVEAERALAADIILAEMDVLVVKIVAVEQRNKRKGICSISDWQ